MKKMNWVTETIRRLLQIFFGTFIFDFPGLSLIRNMVYRTFINLGPSAVLSSKVRFYVPHGLEKKAVSVGNSVRISENVRIDCSGVVTIGNNVWISENAVILNHVHLISGREPKQCKDIFSEEALYIGDDAWIGANVIILPKVKRIGNGAIIGAGSTVTKDVEDFAVVAGNPAVKIRTR